MIVPWISAAAMELNQVDSRWVLQAPDISFMCGVNDSMLQAPAALALKPSGAGSWLVWLAHTLAAGCWMLAHLCMHRRRRTLKGHVPPQAHPRTDQ